MPERAIVETATGALATAVAYADPVPYGRRRLVLQVQAYHDDDNPAGLYLEIGIFGPGSPGQIIKTSGEIQVLALQGGQIGAGTNLANDRPFAMTEGEYIGVSAAGAVGAGHALSIRQRYVEWYYDFEPVPWQVLLSGR